MKNEPQDIVVFGEKTRRKSSKKWPIFTPFFGLPQMAKGNSQMERENSEDRRHIKTFILFAYRSFCHTEN